MGKGSIGDETSRKNEKVFIEVRSIRGYRIRLILNGRGKRLARPRHLRRRGKFPTRRASNFFFLADTSLHGLPHSIPRHLSRPGNVPILSFSKLLRSLPGRSSRERDQSPRNSTRFKIEGITAADQNMKTIFPDTVLHIHFSSIGKFQNVLDIFVEKFREIFAPLLEHFLRAIFIVRVDVCFVPALP